MRGGPCCLLPDALIEIDGHLVEAREAYDEMSRTGRLRAVRTHKGRYQMIEAASCRHVDEEITRFWADGVAWPVEVTGEHPVLVAAGRYTKWKLARDLTLGDYVLLPYGPGYTAISLDGDRVGRPRLETTVRTDRRQSPVPKTTKFQHSIDHSGMTSTALMTLTRLKVPKGNHYNVRNLTSADLIYLSHAFGIEPYLRTPRRFHKGLCRLRREMYEHGLPLSMIGMGPGALRQFVYYWGDFSEPYRDERGRERQHVVLRLDQERLGCRDERALRDGAYTLWRALLSADVPAGLSVEKGADGADVLTLTGATSARYLGQAYDQKKYRGTREIAPGRHHIGSHTYAFGRARITKIERVHYTGPVYAFQVEEDASFVACGIATHNSRAAPLR